MQVFDLYGNEDTKLSISSMYKVSSVSSSRSSVTHLFLKYLRGLGWVYFNYENYKITFCCYFIYDS
jgi:hypothetical protein